MRRTVQGWVRPVGVAVGVAVVGGLALAASGQDQSPYLYTDAYVAWADPQYELNNQGGPGQVAIHSPGGSPTISMAGSEPGEVFGFATAIIGDVTGDGVRDVLVGAPMRGGGEIPHGGADLFDGATGALIRSFGLTFEDGGWQYGWNVGDPGDVNSDGTPDVAVAFVRKMPREGEGLVPRDTGVVIYSGSTGARLMAFYDHLGGGDFGSTIWPLPDIDNDGVPNLAIGAAYGQQEVGIDDGLVFVLAAPAVSQPTVSVRTSNTLAMLEANSVVIGLRWDAPSASVRVVTLKPGRCPDVVVRELAFSVTGGGFQTAQVISSARTSVQRADIDGNGLVDSADLAGIGSQIGATGTVSGTAVAADIDGSGTVTVNDLVAAAGVTGTGVPTAIGVPTWARDGWNRYVLTDRVYVNPIFTTAQRDLSVKDEQLRTSVAVTTNRCEPDEPDRDPCARAELKKVLEQGTVPLPPHVILSGNDPDYEHIRVYLDLSGVDPAGGRLDFSVRAERLNAEESTDRLVVNSIEVNQAYVYKALYRVEPQGCKLLTNTRVTGEGRHNGRLAMHAVDDPIGVNAGCSMSLVQTAFASVAANVFAVANPPGTGMVAEIASFEQGRALTVGASGQIGPYRPTQASFNVSFNIRKAENRNLVAPDGRIADQLQFEHENWTADGVATFWSGEVTQFSVNHRGSCTVFATIAIPEGANAAVTSVARVTGTMVVEVN